MADIGAKCDACGQIQLNHLDVIVLFCLDNRQTTYAFTCPCCDKVTVRAAEDRLVALLMSVGVRCREWRLPQELDEVHVGEPITWDDVLNLHNDLEAGARAWLAAVPRAHPMDATHNKESQSL